MPVELLLLIAIGAILFLFSCLGWLKTRAFRERFPPISDEEFLARCSPGTEPWIALKVRRILSEALAVEYERIYPTSRLQTDLGAE